MKKNNDIAFAGATVAVAGFGSQVSALSGVATSLITTASATGVAGTAVSAGSIIAGGIISTIGAPAAIIGGFIIYALFAED